MSPLVSILIPVYNRKNLVGETIDSAIKQTYKNIEIVIVDNCSSDGTWELLQEFAQKDSRIRIFQNPENIGPVRNWKRCIDEAKGEYAKLLFSDDLISENFIEETLKLFDINVAFVLSGIKVFSKEKSYTLDNFSGLKEITIQKYFENSLLFGKYHFPVSPGCALFRTKDLIQSLEIDIANPFGLDFNKYGAGNDLLLFLNTANKYNKICVSTNAIAFFRSHNGSFSIANRLNTYYEYAKLHFIEKHYPMLLPKFKAVLWTRRKRKLTDDKIYNLVKGRIAWFYLIKQLMIKLYQITTVNL
jgi:glycosyltransferase involved in cell wall biosynthesis